MKKFLKLIFSVLSGYLLGQSLWVLTNLLKADPVQTLSRPQNKLFGSNSEVDDHEGESYIVFQAIENGIERVSYYPKNRRFETPILFQHGMFHSAWCWHLWQEKLAEWGWESHAISLPGHGDSPVQRPIPFCTLDYYLSFLSDEIERYETRPVLIGHSMGGALAQWYLKYVADDLPAAVLLASWPAASVIGETAPDIVRMDPAIVPQMIMSWDASSWIRNPHRVAQKFLGVGSVVSPDSLYRHLSPDSALVLFQHNPPFWYPLEDLETPMIVLAGEYDPLINLSSLRQTAAHYNADYAVIDKAPHNMMMAHNWLETAELIHNWLLRQGLS